MNKLVETPLDDHSRSRNTSLVHKHHSLAQLNFIIAKRSSFILKKQYKDFPTTHNVSDEIFQSPTNYIPPSTVPELSTVPPTLLFNQPLHLIFYKREVISISRTLDLNYSV